MEAKRQRVSDLLDAGAKTNDVCRIVGCSRRLVAHVKKHKDAGRDFSRKPGSGGHNKKLTAEFLADLKVKIEASPSTSQRNLAKTLDVSKRSIQKAINSLG